MAPATGSAAANHEAPLGLDAVELRDCIAGGALKATDLARACLDRVRAVESEVRAWAWLDEGHVMTEAARLDALRRTGRAIGPLHGLPVGVKDIIDTARIPTGNGTLLEGARARCGRGGGAAPEGSRGLRVWQDHHGRARLPPSRPHDKSA